MQFQQADVRTAQLSGIGSAPCHRIAPGDTVRLTVLRGPDELLDATVAFEIWDRGGAQPINSHADSVETFLFLRGKGVAISDGVETMVEAGQLLVLPPGSQHQILNTGEDRLYALTTMYPDDGFAELILSGPRSELDDEDLAVLSSATAASGMSDGD